MIVSIAPGFNANVIKLRIQDVKPRSYTVKTKFFTNFFISLYQQVVSPYLLLLKFGTLSVFFFFVSSFLIEGHSLDKS